MRFLALFFLPLLLLPTIAIADPFEDGQAAYLNKDFQTALKLWQPLADQGNVKAQVNMGRLYRSGEGVTKNYAEALKWYRKAARQGDEYAQLDMGEMYAYGRGVSKDPVEAMKWYRKAADQGNASAQLHIGAMYGAGDGVSKDYAESMKWFRKSADQGNPYAQLNVGKMYEKGWGVKQDYEEAYFWRLLAEKSAPDNRPVPANFAARQYYLTPEQAVAVMKRAEEWKAAPTQRSTSAPPPETR